MAVIINTQDLEDLAPSLSPSEVYWLYNGLDVTVTYDVLENVRKQMDPIALETYHHAMELTAPFMEMSLRGFPLDLNRRDEIAEHYRATYSKLEKMFTRVCVEGLGLPVAPNPGSPKQMKEFFHETLGLPEKKKRKKGADEATVTLDRETLESLAATYMSATLFVAIILAMRDAKKALGFINSKFDADNKLRCNFNIAGTNTGRLSSSISDLGTGTNMQNVSGKLKDLFIAEPGDVIFDIDLEQGDSRGVAALAWNWFLESHGSAFAGSYLDACESGDLHTTVCRMAWPSLSWTDDPKLNKEIAGALAYRDKSYRDLAKALGHGCLTEEHEVLTPEGWVPIGDKPPVLMQWEEGSSSFATVSHWEDKPYTGEMHTFLGTSLHADMTADHRVPYKADTRSTGIKERPAAMGPQAFMPLGNGWVGGDEVVPARLIAAHMADGYQEKNWMAFHFRKERKRERLISLCEEYGYEYRIQGDKLRVRGQLPKYPGAFQFNWTADCLRQFVDELKFWDGHQSTTAVSISSTRRQDLEWFQTFGRILGVGGNIQKPQVSGFGSTTYRLQQNNRQWANGPNTKWEKRKVENLRVLCPTVPTGWFYVRAGGKIFVTGNTNYLGQPRTMASHSKVPVRQIEQFQAGYFSGFPCVKEWQNETIRRLTEQRYLFNLFDRRRYFWGDPSSTSVRNAAIAYAPQSTTGEFINRGILQLYKLRNALDLPIKFILQVHDSLVVFAKADRRHEMKEILTKTLPVTKVLEGGREFTIPLGFKMGFNYGAFDPEKNPYGMMKYSPADERRAPRRVHKSFTSLLDKKMSAV